MLALATQLGSDGRVAGYVVQRVDVAHCKATVEKRLGNPDLLVEFGYAPRSGWWLTGAIEQTLLHSTDGRRWRNVVAGDPLLARIPAGWLEGQKRRVPP